MVRTGLLSALWERQQRLGWSDGQLAREIGVSKSAISLLKAGKRHAGAEVIESVLARFPELLGYLLPTDGGSTAEPVSVGTERSPPG